MRTKEQAAAEPLDIAVAANDIERCFKHPGWEERCAAHMKRAVEHQLTVRARLDGRPAKDIFEAFGRT